MEQKVETPRMLEEKQFLPLLPNDPHEGVQEIASFGSEVFGHTQMHRCLNARCGTPPGEKNVCPFGLPRADGEGCKETRPHFFLAYHTKLADHNIEMYDYESEFNPNDESVSCVLVIWELRRPHPCDGLVVETNK